MLPFFLGRGSGCENVFPKMYLLDKTFEILVEGLVLGSPVSLTIMEREIVLRSGTGRIRFRTLHPRLTLDVFEGVLDQELQWGEFVIYSITRSGLS